MNETVRMGGAGKARSAWAALVLGAAALLAPGASAQEADYPNDDIDFVCAFPAGSGADVLVRYFAEKVRPLTGQSVIVDNRAGAAGNIAAQYVAKAKPDGYTIYVHGGSATAANMHLFKNPVIDAAKDLDNVATINKQPFMLTVRADAPYKTVAELTAAMKEKGDKASYATTATSGKVMGAVYRELAGLTAVEVPYSTGADTVNDMASGAVDYALHDPVHALAQQREGRLRILAVSTGERIKALPDVPTMKESGIDMDQTGWWGVMVPTGTPEPIKQKINGWFKEVLSNPETEKFLNGFGGDVFISTPEEADALLTATVDEWAEYVRVAKIPVQ